MVRLAIIAAILTMLGAGLYKYGEDRYDQGWNAHQAEVGERSQLVVKALNEKKNQLKKARTKRDEIEQKLIDITNNPPPPEVVTHEVVKEVKCDNLDGIVRMWNYYHDLSSDIDRVGDQGDNE